MTDERIQRVERRTQGECEWAHNNLSQVIDSRIANCKGDIGHELHVMNETLSAFSSAFPQAPDGKPDFGGHRDYHDSLIAAAKAEERFWTELRQDLLKKGILWGVIVLFGFIAIGVQVKLGMLKIMS